MTEVFREVTVATGWIARTLHQEISRRSHHDGALAEARVHHVGQDEIRIALPGGTVIVIGIQIEEEHRS